MPMLQKVLAAALLLLARPMPSLAQTDTNDLLTIQTSIPSESLSVPPVPTSEGQMSILPISTSNTGILTQPEATSNLASDTGVMSIPAGETPLLPTNTTNSTNSTSTPSASSTSSAPPEQSTGAAALGQTAGEGAPALLAAVLGFAWALL